MPHDANGKELNVGDTVVFRGVVTETWPMEDHNNIHVQGVYCRKADGLQEILCSINSGSLELVEKAPPAEPEAVAPEPPAFLLDK